MFFFRPPFPILDVWLEDLAKLLAAKESVPEKMRHDIENYNGANMTEEHFYPIFQSPKSDFTPFNGFGGSANVEPPDSGSNSILGASLNINPNSPNKNQSANENLDPTSIINSAKLSESNDAVLLSESEENHGAQTNSVPFAPAIPLFPYLGKDFSPNGDRLRNSIRVRRQERLQKQESLQSLENMRNLQATTPWDSSSTYMTQVANGDGVVPKLTDFPGKPKPYDDRAFIIRVNDGCITLNGIDDLNSCQSGDFDSSCDTSLSYIEPDSIDSTVATNAVLLAASNCLAALNVQNDERGNEIHSDISSDAMSTINKCNRKLDALKIQDTSAGKPVDTKSMPMEISKKQIIKKEPCISSPPRPIVKSSMSTNINGKSIKPGGQYSSYIIPKSNLEHTEKAAPKTANVRPQTRNYYKNTKSFMEKINEVDRHIKPIGDEKHAVKKNGGKKTRINGVESGAVTKKPPTSSSPKKRNDNNLARKTNTQNTVAKK